MGSKSDQSCGASHTRTLSPCPTLPPLSPVDGLPLHSKPRQARGAVGTAGPLPAQVPALPLALQPRESLHLLCLRLLVSQMGMTLRPPSWVVMRLGEAPGPPSRPWRLGVEARSPGPLGPEDRAGRASLSKGPESECSRLGGHKRSVARTRRRCRSEAATDNTHTIGHGCVPGKPHWRMLKLELHGVFTSHVDFFPPTP